MIKKEQAISALDKLENISAHFPLMAGNSCDTLRQYIEQGAQTHKAEDAPSDAELLDWLIAKGRYVNHDIDGYRLCEPDDGESINGPFDDGRDAIRRAIAQERKA